MGRLKVVVILVGASKCGSGAEGGRPYIYIYTYSIILIAHIYIYTHFSDMFLRGKQVPSDLWKEAPPCSTS